MREHYFEIEHIWLDYRSYWISCDILIAVDVDPQVIFCPIAQRSSITTAEAQVASMVSAVEALLSPTSVAAVAEVKAEDAAEETLAEGGHSKVLP